MFKERYGICFKYMSNASELVDDVKVIEFLDFAQYIKNHELKGVYYK